MTTLGKIAYWRGFVRVWPDRVGDVTLVAALRPDDAPATVHELRDLTRYDGPSQGGALRVGFIGPDPQQVLEALAERVQQEMGGGATT